MSIPLQLITGFLGSGKTTFLKNYLTALGAKAGKIAIIQNEFSPVSVDGNVLKSEFSYEMLEVNNGSVFCVCLLGAFIDSLQAFAEEVKPDLLLMESSGLSDTLGVGQVFQSPKLRGKVYLDKVWCLVDGLHFNRTPALRLRLEHQVRSADFVVISKLDLQPESELDLLQQLRKINPFATVLRGDFGKLADYSFNPKPKFFPAGEAIPGRPDVESLVIRSSLEIEKDALLRFIQSLGENCIRGKGFVRMRKGTGVYAQIIFGRLELTELNRVQASTELVLLGHFDKKTNLQIIFDNYCR